MERTETSRPIPLIHFDKVLKILWVHQSPVAIKRAVHTMNYQSKLVSSLVNYHVVQRPASLGTEVLSSTLITNPANADDLDYTNAGTCM
jgi:hypothetical protein